MKKILLPALIACFAAACTPDKTGNDGGNDSSAVSHTAEKPRVKGPAFSGDSAYASVKAQVAFGPRVPETKAHEDCAAFIIAHLKRHGFSPVTQEAPVTTFTGKQIHLKNIFAQFHPERKDRILLLAHWDTRPWADEDPDTTARKSSFDGADDGASGVAVLLELARALQQKDPGIGVDFLFDDAEDWGNDGGASETWCLGTQYWTAHLPKDYTARFGILLDMVGGKGATFPREGTSAYYAADVVEKVWNDAARLGYGNYFVNDITGETTDDHLFVNQNLRIPTIDIVHYNMQTHSYPEWHHRRSDNMDNIDPATMAMVGAVLVDVIYNEAAD